MPKFDDPFDDPMKPLINALKAKTDQELLELHDEGNKDPNWERPSLPLRLKLREVCQTKNIDMYIGFEITRRWVKSVRKK